VERRSGLRFVGDSPEDYIRFEKMVVASKLCELKMEIDAAFNQILADLKSDVHTCASRLLGLPRDENNEDRASQGG